MSSEKGKYYRIILIGIISLIAIMGCDNGKTSEDAGDILVKKEGDPGFINEWGTVSEEIDELVGRSNWQKPDTIIALMGNLRNKTVADIGSGTGFFTFRILPLAKKTIGIDINRNILNYLDSIRTNYLPEEVGEKLELRHVRRNDPLLKDGEVDIIFIANTFVFLPDKENYLRKLKAALKESGRIFIVDYKMQRIAVGPDRDQKIPQYMVEDYLINAGYKILMSDDRILPYQYIIIAEVQED